MLVSPPEVRTMAAPEFEKNTILDTSEHLSVIRMAITSKQYSMGKLTGHQQQ